MYTQCPECQTIFELGVDDLKAAEGQVCCGECDRVFNALASLTELPSSANPPAAHTVGAAQEENPPQAEAAEPASGDLFEDQAAAETEEQQSWEPDGEVVASDEVESLEQSRWEQKLEELGLNETPVAAEAGASEAEETDDEVATDAGQTHDTADWLLPDDAPRARWPWLLGAALAGIALLGQAMHHWREDLARSPALGPYLKSLYSGLGAPIPERWDVQAYRVAKDRVSDHPEVPGALLVSANLANAGVRAQPFPLLRITLLDRWGDPLGERFFAPGEYLPRAVKSGDLIAAGATVEASVLIVDPGAGAVSYGIDACLRDADNRLLCAHESAY